MQDKKALDIRLLDLRSVPGAVATSFIICSGNSTRQVAAIAEAVIMATQQQAGIKPWHQEGMQVGQWVLLDYGDTVVHIFQQPQRDYYALEALWGDAQVTALERA